MFKVCRRNFKLYNFELECGFCNLICFIVPVYTIMAWNLADVFYPDWKHNNNCTIYPRCMDDQYSYYEETVNRKVNLKIL